MKYIKINGGKPLQGEISIGGAKNSAVALIPAALLANSKCRIEKIPDISDKDALFDILKVLNADFKFNDKEVIIDPTNLKNVLIPEDLSNKLRASYYFMGVLLAKFKKDPRGRCRKNIIRNRANFGPDINKEYAAT